MNTETLTTASDSINIGAALEVVRNFLDSVARSSGGAVFVKTPEYVAARCVLERLFSAEEPPVPVVEAHHDDPARQ